MGKNLENFFFVKDFQFLFITQRKVLPRFTLGLQKHTYADNTLKNYLNKITLQIFVGEMHIYIYIWNTHTHNTPYISKFVDEQILMYNFTLKEINV